MSATRAVAIKTNKNATASARQHKNTQSGPDAALQSQPGFPVEQVFIQRKENACACGGGCPKCLGNLGIQPKLTIGAPNDKYEQEADRVADQVMRMPAPKVQRQPLEEEEEELQAKPLAGHVTTLIQRQEILKEEDEDEELLQTKTAGDSTLEVTSEIGSGIQSLRGGGRPLSVAERGFFEPRFGTDFSSVRVHSDARAARVARSVNARAFTLGRNVVFGAGEYFPGSSSGRKLLAHELTHVVQQQGAVPEGVARDVGEEGAIQVSRCTPRVQFQPNPGQGQSGGGQITTPNFPAHGVKVIGGGATDLAQILSFCVGDEVTVNSSDMLVENTARPIPSSQMSAAATSKLTTILNDRSVGIIIDTNPNAPMVQVGGFSHAHPGYQQIDVANVLVLAAASGSGRGLIACDSIMHEITEAYEARKRSQAGTASGQALWTSAHGAGTSIENQIRTEFGQSPRRQSQGSMVMMGQIGQNAIAFLDSIVFGSGSNRSTQVSVVRCTLGPVQQSASGTSQQCIDLEVVASHVVDSLVNFRTQREAVRIFNRYASDFGLQPIQVPSGP